MNGVHDMGGMHGMGPVVHEKDEPVFHEAWEGRIYALTRLVRAGGGRWNIDAGRHQIEQIPAAYHDAARIVVRVARGVIGVVEQDGVLRGPERGKPDVVRFPGNLGNDIRIGGTSDADGK